MTDEVPAKEAQLLAALRQALGSDQLPSGLIERAEELLALKNLDSALVELLDHAAAEPAGMRGGSVGTRLEFTVADGSVALELVPERDRLVGQIVAGDVTEVALEHPGGTVATVAVDDLGRFTFDTVSAGPRRLRLSAGIEAPVTTDWFLL